MESVQGLRRRFRTSQRYSRLHKNWQNLKHKSQVEKYEKATTGEQQTVVTAILNHQVLKPLQKKLYGALWQSYKYERDIMLDPRISTTFVVVC